MPKTFNPNHAHQFLFNPALSHLPEDESSICSECSKSKRELGITNGAVPPPPPPPPPPFNPHLVKKQEKKEEPGPKSEEEAAEEIIKKADLEKINLSSSTAILIMTIRKPGNLKKLKTEDVVKEEVKAAEAVDRLLSQYKLDNSPELEAISRFDSQTRKQITDWSLGNSLTLGGGSSFQSIKMVPRIIAYLNTRFNEREALINAFIEAYPITVKETEALLTPLGLFNPIHFPPADQRRAEFQMRWRWIEIGTAGSLKQLKGVAYEEEIKKAQEDVKEQVIEMRANARRIFQGLVDTLFASLDPAKNPGQSIKGAKDGSWAAGLMQFIELWDAKNITGDSDLTSLVETTRKLVTGIKVEELRKDEELRKEIAKGLENVKEEVKGLVVKELNYRRFRG